MPELYPLLLIPSFDERPWGVRDLRPVYTKVVKEPIGESWLTWGQNVVANGPLSGRTLGEVAQQYRRELVGTVAPYEDRFPLLVKFLFTADKLSVQVHPDDEAAHRVGEPFGKTECWYVLDAKPGAQVALGLKPGVSVEDFRHAIAGVQAEQLLNWMDVQRGDMLYVAAGTVHTIGGGLVLLETQQASDVTYRLYDYGRPRELHIDQGLAAIKLNSDAGKVVQNPKDRFLGALTLLSGRKNGIEQRARGGDDARFCRISLLRLTALAYSSLQAWKPVSFARGDAIVVPACVPRYSVRPQWDLEIMRMSLPAGEIPEPETVLGAIGQRA